MNPHILTNAASSKRSLDHAAEDLVWLAGTEAISPELFGRKAAALCLSGTLGWRVPCGFAVSAGLVARIATGCETAVDRLGLLSFWGSAMRTFGGASAIVRSSSSVENPSSTSFSGVFRSVRGIRSYEELITAIRRCHGSAHSIHARRYADLRHADLPMQHMGVLVQQEIRATHSALLQVSTDEYFMVEAFQGGLARRIQGHGSPDYVARVERGKRRILRSSREIPASFVAQVHALADDVKQFLATTTSADAVLELASDGSAVFILQLDLVGNVHAVRATRPSLHVEMRGTVLEPYLTPLGVKGAAMHYFAQAGMFELPLCAFPANCDVATVEATARSVLPNDRGFTARFSKDIALALPRRFAPDLTSLIGWIRATRQEGWATIIHPHILVRRSFELLVTDSEALLEHIPGMWESDNVLDPDVLMFKASRVQAWRYAQPRSAHLAGTGHWKHETVAPVALADMKHWATRLAALVDTLRRDFAPALPLNFHFVEDNDGRWYFLNIRPGFRLDMPRISDEPAHVVRTADDLEDWNRTAPILLRFTAARGDEDRVLAIAEKLPKRVGFSLLVDFGQLSHPAMILRELGYSLLPTYLHGGSGRTGKHYRRHRWLVDRDFDPVRRIRSETSVFQDRRVRVVPDRDPIIPGHLLVLAEQAAESFSDCSNGDSLAALLTSGALSGIQRSRYVFVERGRARFCTSGFTGSHAHGHLLPIDRLEPSAVADFAVSLGAARHEGLLTALAHASQSSGEYILIAVGAGDAFLKVLPEGQSFDKRLIRRFFGGRTQ
jgi:diadenosine tetraphosphate (Ap4A) HIT family hydrolase